MFGISIFLLILSLSSIQKQIIDVVALVKHMSAVHTGMSLQRCMNFVRYLVLDESESWIITYYRLRLAYSKTAITNAVITPCRHDMNEKKN